jgi:hypothetical protein
MPLAVFLGLRSDGVSREELEEIDVALKQSSSMLPEATAFMGALEGFDLNDTAFVANTLDSIR